MFKFSMADEENKVEVVSAADYEAEKAMAAKANEAAEEAESEVEDTPEEEEKDEKSTRSTGEFKSKELLKEELAAEKYAEKLKKKKEKAAAKLKKKKDKAAKKEKDKEEKLAAKKKKKEDKAAKKKQKKENKANKKAEKKAKKLQKKIDKAEKKAARKREKEHKKEIERLNRMLKPVSKKTLESLKIISFDPEVATLRMTENNWLKTYKIEGMNENNRNQFIDGLVDILSLRARITSNFSVAESNRLIRTDFITFFISAEIYETVKLTLDAEVDKINTICDEINIVEISLNNYMNQVTRNFQHDGEELNFEKLKRRKHDWKNIAFNNITLNDDCFTINERIGTCMQVIQFPGEVGRNFLQELLEINMPMMFITDIQPYKDEENEDFKKLMAKKYNAEIEEFENSYMNVGLTIIIMTDTTEKKDALIDAIEEFFAEEQMVISPIYGNAADVLESSLSYGIKDYHSMRNMQNAQIKQLVV